MKSVHVPPGFRKAQFHCIYCNVFAHQHFTTVILDNPREPAKDLWGSVCVHCGKWAFWYLEKMVVPSASPAEPTHPDLPEDCRMDYEEARDVFSKSPRAAAALLRLCIQKLLPHLGEKGENINSDIASLVAKGLPVLVQKALDICRVVGNNAVHPGEIDLNDTPEIASKLFQMINFIVEDRITRPKDIHDLYGDLPESARNAIEKRDKPKA